MRPESISFPIIISAAVMILSSLIGSLSYAPQQIELNDNPASADVKVDVAYPRIALVGRFVDGTTILA